MKLKRPLEELGSQPLIVLAGRLEPFEYDVEDLVHLFTLNLALENCPEAHKLHLKHREQLEVVQTLCSVSHQLRTLRNSAKKEMTAII